MIQTDSPVRPPLSPAGLPRALTVIFKGTTRCNARCHFCSAAAGEGRSITSEDFELLANRIEGYAAESALEALHFTFHGGEPTLLGPAFLETACLRLLKLPVPVSFAMQSNLLAVDTATATVVRRYGIQTGSSIDPIQSGRWTASGDDTLPRWMENRYKLDRAGIPVGAIFLVTRPALGQGRRVQRILESFRSLDWTPPGFQLNLVYPQGRAAHNADLLVSAREAGQFLVDAYEAWEGSGRAVSMSPFEELSDWFESGRKKSPRLSCGFMGQCDQTHVGVDAELNVAGCGRRLDAGAVYGSLRSRSLAALLSSSEERHQVRRRAEQLAAGPCAGCEFFPVCHGGCPDDAAVGAGDLMSRSEHCEAYRMLFEAMAARAVPRVRAELMSNVSDTVIQVSTDPRTLSSEQVENWILPTTDGRAIGFRSHLDYALGPGVRRVRIWAPAAQVKLLHLWARALRDPRVEVVLFDDGSSLERSVEILARLRTRVWLDIPHLLRSGWSSDEALALAKRYVNETGWKLPLHPFERILVSAVRGERVPLLGPDGLTPGRLRVCVGSLGGASDEAQEVVRRLLDAERATCVSAYLANRECAECSMLGICGGQFAPGTGGPCSSAVRAVVSELQASAASIRDALGEDGLAAVDRAD